MKAPKIYKVKKTRWYARGSMPNSTSEIEGTLEYIQKYFGVQGKTIKSVLNAANKGYEYTYGACYSGAFVELVK